MPTTDIMTRSTTTRRFIARVLDGAASLLESRPPAFSRIVEHDGAWVERVRIEGATRPLQHGGALWMPTITDDLQKLRVPCRAADVFGRTRTREQQVPIIDALVNNNQYFAQVNIPNKGALAGVADDVVVEVPALVNAKGIQPLRVHPLPPKIQLEMILPEVLEMERELLAFKTGDRTMLLWEALNSPQTHSYDQAVAVLNDLLDAPELQEAAERYQWPKGW